jgi:hypothetical protein
MNPTSSFAWLRDLAISRSRTIQKKYGTFVTDGENALPKASDRCVLS